ncbi:MAG: NAD(P)-dependent oxidoreductase [Ahniella sp.]|nr:NAD(P)-dependent oxidoreductase [Ahniella sp.]
MSVAFIGLGAMGGPMAGHVSAAGLLKAVGNRTFAKAEAFAAAHEGVVAVESLAQLPESVDVVISCVTADADVLELAQSLAALARPGLVLIDHSTIASASAVQAAEIMRAAGGDFLDAPVSGGVEGARNGKLSIMAGGHPDTLGQVQPILQGYAARITHMGDVGAGQNTKAVNQVLVAGIAQAVCEGMALAEALGLDPTRLLPTLGAGAAQNWFMERRGPTMLANQFSSGFKLALLHKDLLIVKALAESAGTDHSIVDKCLADYGTLMAQGHGDDEISSLIRLKRKP